MRAWVLATMAGCTMQEPPPEDAGAIDAGHPDAKFNLPDYGPGGFCRPADGELVALETDDGVVLDADLYTRGIEGERSAILLHMTPSGGHDRTNFPVAFIRKLQDFGVSVLNTNRRGVGGSDELKRAAYLGPDGKLDAKAAYDFLVAHPCRFDPARVGIVGASNGTTTALDFTVFAGADPELEIPKALVFLTGGTYTENQNRIADHRTLLDGIPILFVYSDTEATWSEALQPGAPFDWSFARFAPGAHGTNIFEARPESIDSIVTWLAEQTF
jgi:hypothetical protein